MKRISFLISLLLLVPALLVGQDLNSLARQLEGASIVAQDDSNTFLGTITGSMDRESIFNQMGNHGSTMSRTSIWNTMGDFGNPMGRYSATNSMTDRPPMIIRNGQVIGFVSTNSMIRSRVSPGMLAVLGRSHFR